MSFKIALPGFDVRTSRVTEEVLDGLYANPKINTKASPPHLGIIRVNWATTGIIIPTDTTRILYSFPHNYGYVPTVFASYAFDNGTIRSNGTLPFQMGGIGIVTIDADLVNINLKYYSFDLASTAITPFLMNVKPYVMAEQGYE